jgi:hypothetical protein
VAIVSERMARRLWNGANPLGRRLRILWNQSGVSAGGGGDVWLTVIGVVGNVRYGGVDDESGLDLYAPHTQLFAGDAFFVARTRTNPDAIRSQLRAALDRVDSEQSFFDVETMRARVNGLIWQHRVATAVLRAFAAIALCLAVIGTYAVTAFTLAAQRREIGIRLALGSTGAQVARLVIYRSLVPVAAGALTGLAIAAALARPVLGVIGLSSVPNLALPAVLPFVLTAAAALAGYLPLRRMLRRVAVSDALRAE